jgi:cell division protein ZapA
MANTVPVRVTIFNQPYTLVATDDAGGVQELAQTVDELMRTISRSGNLDTTRTAVLACLHLADQLRTLQREHDGFKRNVDTKAKELGSLLDSALGPQTTGI